MNSVINVTETGFPVLEALCDGRWIFSLRDWEDPDVRIAKLTQVRRALTFGIDVLCSFNPLQSSCIPLSQYKSQVVC